MIADHPRGVATRTVRVPIGAQELTGDLALPANARGLVVFAHGSGSSRFSPRNRRVAERLQRNGLATLLFDLLTEREDELDERSGELRFDIPMLADRLVAIVEWLRRLPETAALPIGLFGASTGGGAALAAAARIDIAAVVSRGGRPDLAGAALPHVTAPTLLIVGGSDTPVIQMNRHAQAHMRAHVVLEIVPGATHLFDEPGTLDRVADLAGAWFDRYLGGDA